MDVLYYWKDLTADIKANRIGYFRATRERVAEFDASFPDYIWVFKTPKGEKGKLQLLARVAWSSTSPPGSGAKSAESVLRYDAAHAHSVCFVDSDREEAIASVSDWMQRHFPGAVRANFQGAHGQQALRGVVLHELTVIAKRFEVRPFISMLPPAKT